MAETYKVGDEMTVKGSPKSEVLVIEQVFLRGKTPHYICSFKNQSWPPVFYNHDYITPVEKEEIRNDR